MRCNILSNLYLKSNASIRCDDDFGERIVLGLIDNQIFSPSKLFNNSLYTHIRDSFSNGLPPFPDVCSKCALYSSGTIHDSFKKRRINKIQIEISLLCDLTCSACSREEQIKDGRKPLLLSLKKIDLLLDGLSKEMFIVNEFEFCGQGEPLNHPQFKLICQTINRKYPRSKVRLITNANFSFDRITNCKIDEIIVSIDGASNQGYGVYRRNGNLNKAITFAKDARAHKKHPKIIWKYILFNGNDSDEEIIHAQIKAKEIGVNEIRFVLTRYGPYSQKYSAADFQNFPIVNELARFDVHPFVTPDAILAKVEISRTIGILYFLKSFAYNITKLLANQSVTRVSINNRKSFDELFIDGIICYRIHRGPMFIIFEGNHYQIRSTQNSSSYKSAIRQLYFQRVTENFRMILNIDKGFASKPIQIKCGYYVGYLFIGHTYEIIFPDSNATSHIP